MDITATTGRTPIRLSYTPAKQVCTCCGEAKLLCEFYVDTYTQKHINVCRECISIKRRVKRTTKQIKKFITSERSKASGGTENYTVQDWKDCMLWFRGRCAFCGKPESRTERLDKDHLVAIAQGGRTNRSNIVPACKCCNRGRGKARWQDWYKKQTFYSKDREEMIRRWEMQP